MPELQGRPPEQNGAGDDEGNAHAYAGERIAEPGEKAGTGSFRVCHREPPVGMLEFCVQTTKKSALWILP